MPRKFEPGAPISPSGWVVMADDGRSPRIAKPPSRSKLDPAYRRCTWCGNAITAKRRRDWCSEACSEEYLRRLPSVVRDRFLRAEYERLGGQPPCSLCGTLLVALEVDHRVPIAEGGDPFDHANLRTLCRWCHRQETTALAKRMAKARREATPQITMEIEE